MALKRIRLELARTPEAPEGNPSYGYEFTAPLDRKGKLSLKEWTAEKDRLGYYRQAELQNGRWASEQPFIILDVCLGDVLGI